MLFNFPIAAVISFHLISFIFPHPGRYQFEERYDGCSEMSPVTIAQQIVCEFRENMEQGELGSLSSEFQAESNLSGVNVNAGAGAEAEAATGKDLLIKFACCLIVRNGSCWRVCSLHYLYSVHPSTFFFHIQMPPVTR